MPSPKVPSAKVLARREAAVELNYAALDEIKRGLLDGLFDLGVAIITGADAPDATPYGQGLVRSGGVIGYVDKKLVRTFSLGADKLVRKPRRARLTDEIVVVAGFGFPGRFQEAGTIHQPARPFLTPAAMRLIPKAGPFIAQGMARHKVISAKRAAQRAGAAGGSE